MSKTYLRLISDLHLKAGQGDVNLPILPEDDQTILLVAGDLGVRSRAVDWLESMSQRFDQVVLVLGNHDFYNHDPYENYDEVAEDRRYTISELRDLWQSELASLSNVHLLENQAIQLNGVRILGATLWTDFLDDPFIMYAAQAMADYRLILDDLTRQSISPKLTQAIHRDTVAWLRERFAQQVSVPTIVLTHHVPTWQCITNRDYLEDELTHAYSTNLDDLIRLSGASLWVYGHNHQAHIMGIGNTQLISNPLGFIGEYTGYCADQQLILDEDGNCIIKGKGYEPR